MNVSPASEIHFWRTGTLSFNTEQEGYTDDYKFNQKFICDAIRRLQGYGTDDYNYRLSILDCDKEISSLDYIRTDVGGSVEEIVNTHFPNLSDWVGRNTTSALINWLSGPNRITLQGASVDAPLYRFSEQLYIDYPFVAGRTYTISINLSAVLSGVGYVTSIANIISIADNSFGILFTNTVSISTGGDPDYDVSITFVATSDCAKILLQCRFLAEDATQRRFDPQDGKYCLFTPNTYNITETTPAVAPNYYLYTLDFNPEEYDLCDRLISFKIIRTAILLIDEVEEWYSDEIEFISEWVNSNSSGRVNIKFKSGQNFAGLIYGPDSEYFSIDIDGRFRKEKKVTTQKTIELTEAVMNTASSLKIQRRLTTGDDLPDYMHTKVNLILAHAPSGSVVINDKEWSVEEGYEEGSRPDTYPLTPADIFLTEKDAYYHNLT